MIEEKITVKKSERGMETDRYSTSIVMLDE